jgi:hypothetical protein
VQDTHYHEPEQGMADKQGRRFPLIRALFPLNMAFFILSPNSSIFFGFNTRNEDFIETHADMLVNMLLGNEKLSQ